MLTKQHPTLSRSLVFTIIALLLLSIASTAMVPGSARANSLDTTVLDWNTHAINVFMNPSTAAIPGAGLPPQVASVHVAIVHGAIFDAVNSIDGGYQPYLAGIPAADPSASTAAAAATAAHRVIVGIVINPPLSPAIVTRVDDLLADSLAAATASDGAAAVAAGVTAGEAAAAAMLAARANDGRWVPYVLTPGTDPGEWRPTPPAFVSDPFAWMAFIDPFMLNSPSQFRSKGPNALHTGIYAKEYDEVKRLGSPTGISERNASQEAVAQFFTANPLEMYSRAFRELATEEGLAPIEQARLFAMMNMSAADALINCVNDKVHWNFWRPITAIQNGDNDGNNKTVGDPAWTSMVPSPPYSEHASGYNCATGAFMHAAAAFFGNGRVDFTLVRLIPGSPDEVRTYKRFADVVDDTIDARVYQGIHFRTADVQGARIGKDVARWMDRHFFEPVK